jgi:tRNA(Arg) A34 adenosine deaminase TadA
MNRRRHDLLTGGSLPATFAEACSRSCARVGGRRIEGLVTGEENPMALALAEARKALREGEVPVGAVLVDGRGGEVLARAHNRVEGLKDPTAHAELLVLQAAARRLGEKRLAGADLYVTLEPCAMCAGAIALARVRRLYFGAYDPKGGAVEHGPRLFGQATCNHRPEVVGGLSQSEAATLLRDFFADRR